MGEKDMGMMNPSRETSEREIMHTPEEVTTILELKRVGWGAKRIARELGISKNTVKVYLRKGAWISYGQPARKSVLEEKAGWVAQRYLQHRGNADVVRQELDREFGLQVSLRTVERAVQPLRRRLLAATVATVRFETPPGKQLQVDFGQTRVWVAEELVWVHLCVLTLGFSRRPYVQAFAHERRHNWFIALEGAFRHFGGVPEEVLTDNTRMLIRSHDQQTREVVFTDSFRAFAAYWGFRPHACAPFRARTKGKDENGVGYVKRNAIAGRRFESWEALASHLQWWMREVADLRVHGSTGERPLDRFLREEVQALRPLMGRAPFVQAREMVRRVHSDLCVELETNHYSVPWRFIGEQVWVQVLDGEVRALYAGKQIASHPLCRGRHQWIVDRQHFQGVAGTVFPRREEGGMQAGVRPSQAELLRPLSDYEEAVGGTK